MKISAAIQRWFSLRKPLGAAAELGFREMAEHSSDMICRIAANGEGKYFSPASLDLFGWTPAEMIAMDPAGFFLAEDLGVLHRATGRLHSGESTSEVCEVRARRRDGSIAWVETRTRMAPATTSGQLGDLIVVLRDITERKKMEEELERHALTDGLTGMANRRAFDTRLQRSWEDTLASGGDMSLLLLDIDHFKRFNDRYGHQAGDDCLRTVALTVVAQVQGRDALAARFGGEEFAVVLSQTNAAAAAALAEQIRRAVREIELPHPDSDSTPFVTVSIGAATAMARDGGSVAMPSGLIQAADIALYKAKRNGRNCVQPSLLLAATE